MEAFFGLHRVCPVRWDWPGRRLVRGFRSSRSNAMNLWKMRSALSILLVLLTPVAYLNGRAFHDGWDEYFKLVPYVFPLDTAGILNNAAMAWLNGFVAVVNVVFTMLIAHWEMVLFYILFAAFIWRSGSWILGRISRWSARRRAAKEARRQSVLRRAVWWIVEPLLGMGISISMIYLMFFGLR